MYQIQFQCLNWFPPTLSVRSSALAAAGIMGVKASNEAPRLKDINPHPVTVTTQTVTFLVGNPYQSTFEVTVIGKGVNRTHPFMCKVHSRF